MVRSNTEQGRDTPPYPIIRGRIINSLLFIRSPVNTVIELRVFSASFTRGWICFVFYVLLCEGVGDLEAVYKEYKIVLSNIAQTLKRYIGLWNIRRYFFCNITPFLLHYFVYCENGGLIVPRICWWVVI